MSRGVPRAAAKPLAVGGRWLFAVATIGLGVTHFTLGEFVTGWAPVWPASMPGGPAWTYVTGTVLVLVGLALLTGKRGRAAALLAAALVALWALLRHLPVLVTSEVLSGAWNDAGKALRYTGGALVMAAALPEGAVRDRRPSRVVNRDDAFLVAGRACLGLTLLVNGARHFIFTEFVASLIPAWFPGDPVFWTYFAGVALIAGGLGLFLPRTAGLAALLVGRMVFSWFWIIPLPRTLAGVSDGIAVFEALVTSGTAFAIAGLETARRPRELAHESHAHGSHVHAARAA